RCPEHFREKVEKGLVEAILRGTPAKVLLPFVVLDPDLTVVSTAALDFAVLRQPDEAFEPFTGPRLLLTYASPDGGLPEVTRAGILTGLVLRGDRRLLPLLDGCWRTLGSEGRRWLARATSGYITAGLIDFFLGWLEQTEDETDFGGIVGTLCRMPSVA